MEETKYTSKENFQNPKFPAGCVFTRSQWEEKGGSLVGLDALIKKKYVTEWEGQAPPKPVSPSPVFTPNTQTVDSAETQTITSEDPEGEESGEEVVKAQGIWKFEREVLEGLELDALNSLYKDTAAKYNQNVRAYSDKDRLIDKMTSEA